MVLLRAFAHRIFIGISLTPYPSRLFPTDSSQQLSYCSSDTDWQRASRSFISSFGAVTPFKMLTQPSCLSDFSARSSNAPLSDAPVSYAPVSETLSTAAFPTKVNPLSNKPSAMALGSAAPSTPQLDRRIDDLIRTYVSSDASPQTAATAPPQADQSTAAPVYAQTCAQTYAHIYAQTYAQTCALLWRSLNQPVSSAALIEHIQRLRSRWPQSDTSPSFKSLNDQWRSPHIQAALKSAIDQLSADTKTLSIYRYSSSWAYLCGALMHQLLP